MPHLLGHPADVDARLRLHPHVNGADRAALDRFLLLKMDDQREAVRIPMRGDE